MDIEQVQQKYGITGESPVIKQVIDKVMQVAPTDITILLQGESGVGKDLVARAIHGLSKRSHENLMIVNCGAIPEGIIESELFGHEKGSFTGAHEGRMGYFEKAHNGTIFLDEIADTPQNLQVKLLRVLENGEYYRVGSSKLRKVDARVIAATNKDLFSYVQDGKFREDLYYRLDTVNIRIPPLRERKEDILLIFRKFVSEFAARYDSVFRGFSDDARDLLTSYRWPGNIRELRNVAEQLVILEKSQFVDKETLQKYLKGRQKLGSTDHLPVVYNREDAENNSRHEHTSGNNDDIQLIYRALVEMRGDISDMKKMLGQFFYRNFHGEQPSKPYKEPYLLSPPASSPATDSDDNHGGGLDDDLEVPLDPNHSTASSEHHPHKDLVDFFNRNDLPTVEETEKLLIKKALDMYEGNRRKASRALGMSERTLYRKIDHYELL